MAKGSGRRSAAERLALPATSPIRPHRRLTAAERRVWRQVVDSWPADHFIASDAALLTAYCAACVAFDAALPADGGPGNLDDMSKGARLMATLATKLRITPQSRIHGRTAGVSARVGRQNAPARKPLLGGGWQDDGATAH